ncbi:hypothetical protein [Sporosarcina sp. FSL K6-5500]|uniref:hypothetical protein n=1 Tax=Sporosarcina sp. FSL K6-5500 TaxID=2921558 RepID=UPI0030FC3A54
MAVILVALVPVSNAGLIIEPNEVFSCENEYAKKLVDNKSAKLHVVTTKKAKVTKVISDEDV